MTKQQGFASPLARAQAGQLGAAKPAEREELKEQEPQRQVDAIEALIGRKKKHLTVSVEGRVPKSGSTEIIRQEDGKLIKRQTLWLPATQTEALDRYAEAHNVSLSRLYEALGEQFLSQIDE